MKRFTQSTIIKDGMYNSFPNIVRAANDTLIMVFRQAENSLKKYGKVSHVDPSSRVAMVISNDEGQTWSDIRVIYNDEMGENDPCIVCLADGTLICTFFRWRVVPLEDKQLLGEAYNHYGRVVFDKWAAVHVGTVCIRSMDNGVNWEGPYEMKPSGFEGPAAMRGNIVELPDGRLLAPLYGVKKLGGLSQCLIVASDDKGISWYSRSEVAGLDEHHFLEPFLYRSPSGRLDILMRTQLDFFKLPFDQTYCNLHVSSSMDNGATWSPPTESALFCPNPIHMLPLNDSQVFASYGQRRSPKGIEAFITDSEHPVFQDSLAIQVRPAESGDLGYTSGVKLHDGSVLIVYYMTDADNDACIGATKVDV